jgi:hypothetical protein
VYETVPAGRQPIGGAWVLLMAGTWGGTSRTDGAGRYAFRDQQPGTFGAVHVYGGPREYRHQPCVVRTRLSGEEVVMDVEYNLVGVPGTGGPPLVTGHVFQKTPEGRLPAPNKAIYYYFPNLLVAYTVTDANGRFEFCRVPLGAGKITAAVDFDPVWWEDILVERRVVVGAGGAHVDIDY